MLDNWGKFPTFSCNNDVEQDRLFLISYRGRTHMGTCMYQNMILNYWQMTCFADLDLLKVGVPEGAYIGTAINALILQRIDSRLLDVPVSDNRAFTENEKGLARRICKKYRSNVLVSDSHSQLHGEGISDIYHVDNSKNISPESILLDKFNDEQNKTLYLQHYLDYGKNLYLNAEQNVSRKDIAFPLQYASVITSAMEMLNISKQSNRYSCLNMERYDLRVLREMINSYPKISELKEIYEKKIKKYQTLRCDILFTAYDDNHNELEVLSDDNNAKVQSPKWLNNGHGYVVESIATEERITIRCLGKGKLIVKIRGVDAKDINGNRYLIQIRVNELILNKEVINDIPIMIDYENGYEIRREISNQDGLVYNLSISWESIS